MQTLVRHASVKRFHPSDQIVHFLNLICWAALAASGIALGSAARASIRPERLDVSVHFRAHHRHRRMARLLAREGKALRA